MEGAFDSSNETRLFGAGSLLDGTLLKVRSHSKTNLRIVSLELPIRRCTSVDCALSGKCINGQRLGWRASTNLLRLGF